MKTIAFGTDGIRGRVGDAPIDCETILKFGWALGQMIYDQYGPAKILIGKDTRISGYMIESLLEAGIIAAGCDAYLLGPVPTPGIAYLTTAFRAKASVVISASHNVFSDNGIKLFGVDGFKFSEAQQAKFLSYFSCDLKMVPSEQLGKATQIHTAKERYVEFCKSKFPSALRLDGMKIIVDCANGANYKVGPAVFYELGAEVITLNDHPDGTNINRDCGSLHPQKLKEAVSLHKADVGIAFDGDGDRLVMVTQSGRILDGDDLLYILASYQRSSNMGVVGTHASNNALKRVFTEKGIPYIQTAVGDHEVVKALQSKAWLIGGESSGHLIQLDKHSCSDAVISALSILSIILTQQMDLDQLIASFEKIPFKTINIPMQHAFDIQPYQKHIQDIQSKLGDFGKLLIRPSGTEPVLRIQIESENISVLETSVASMKALFTHG